MLRNRIEKVASYAPALAISSNAEGQDFMKDLLSFFLYLFWLGLLALIILACSAIWSRSKRAVLTWGVIAIGPMVLQCLFISALENRASDFSGSPPDHSFTYRVIIVFGVSLFLYFFVTLGRIMIRK
jgi:hypothetical protein